MNIGKNFNFQLIKMYILLMCIFVLGNCPFCRTLCTYPSELVGEWYSTSFGTLNFITSQSFSGFTSALSATPLTFTCYESSGNQYVSMSTIDITGLNVEVFLCMDLQKLSAVKFFFRLESNRDVGTGVRFYTPASSGDTVNLSQACSRSDTRSSGEYELLVKKDQISSAVINCPTHFQSTFNVTMTTSAVDSCQGTYLYGSSGALVFNFSSCVTGQFSNVGYLQCLYSLTDTYSYVTLYNNETTTDETSTYKFTCLAYEKDGEILRATESTNRCQQFQSPSAVDNTGITYVMTDLLYTDEGRDYTAIIIVVCVISGSVIIIVVIIVVYIKFCRKPKPEQPRPIRKLKRKPSVTDYTARIVRGGKSVDSLDKSAIHKQSTGEIITGVLAHKKHDSVLIKGDSYEPPKKEAWQRKWEAERNKVPSRLTRESLLRLKQSFSSDGDISRLEKLSVSDLDKAYTLSTSLPESLDIAVKPNQTQTHLPTTDAKTNVSTLNNKYSEKSHASTSIPASMGKFGGSPKIRSTESVHLPSAEPKLDTISENPLSRENTAPAIQPNIISRKQLKEHPNLTCLVNSDIASLSTVLASQSTASVGDIRFQNSFQNISSRNSHLSASNSCIFDDPGWLMENKQTRGNIESIKNIIPPLPTATERDIRWFIKAHNKPKKSREDIDYFKNRNKSYVGLNSSLGFGSSNSMEIIAREKMQRKNKKNKISNSKLIRPVSPYFED